MNYDGTPKSSFRADVCMPHSTTSTSFNFHVFVEDNAETKCPEWGCGHKSWFRLWVVDGLTWPDQSLLIYNFDTINI